MSASSRELFRECLIGLLYPIVRFAIRHSLKFRDVIDCLRIVFVKVAKEELLRSEHESTISKLSAMTGIQRRELKSLVTLEAPPRRDADVIARIIGLWQSSARYKDDAGRPRILGFKARKGEFAKLVEKVSTDLNPYTIAFELTRAGIAEQQGDALKLLKPGYQPSGNVKEALRLLQEDSSDLHAAVSENIFEQRSCPNLHVKTEYDNIPSSHEQEVREWFLSKGAQFHEEARQYLSKFDRDINPSLPSSSDDKASLRAVIGTFGYTEKRQ